MIFKYIYIINSTSTILSVIALNKYNIGIVYMYYIYIYIYIYICIYTIYYTILYYTILCYTTYMCIYYTSANHIQSWKDNILICLNIDSNQHPSTEVMRGMTNKNSWLYSVHSSVDGMDGF